MKWFFGGGRGRGCGAAAAAAAAGAPKPRLDPRLKKTGLFSHFGLYGKILEISGFVVRFALILGILDRFGAFLDAC